MQIRTSDDQLFTVPAAWRDSEMLATFPSTVPVPVPFEHSHLVLAETVFGHPDLQVQPETLVFAYRPLAFIGVAADRILDELTTMTEHFDRDAFIRLLGEPHEAVRATTSREIACLISL